jgi:hypothetical protein
MLPHDGRRHRVSSGKPSRIINRKKEKNCLVPDAEVSAAEMVLREEFAGRAEAAYLSH